MTRAYYNEIDAYAAQWLRNLIAQGLIADGDVDTRSISDVRPVDLKGYTQCHFFAGIGGWSAALRLSGVWPDHREVWTGSCPCQPFSSAGEGSGVADERHLWPSFFWLIQQCAPPIVFGEQVASKLGREWFSGVRADLENVDYAVGAADLCAAGVGSPQIRQRIYWVAHTHNANQDQWAPGGQQSIYDQDGRDIARLGSSESEQWNGSGAARNRRGKSSNASLAFERVGCVESWASWTGRQPWQYAEAVECDDGWRRIESGASPLVARIPSRLDKIRGYGNSIVPQLAAKFILASA